MPYHRVQSPTQTVRDARRQEEAGEIWGREARGGNRPKVKAYVGPLPNRVSGIEFETDVPPDRGCPPGQAYWSGDGDKEHPAMMRKRRPSPASEWGNDFGEPIAVLRLEPDELARRHGFDFQSGYDDLDDIQVARVRTKGRMFALLRHVHSPKPGTEVVALSRSRNMAHDVASILHRLNLDESDLAWKHPTPGRTPARPIARKTRSSRRDKANVLAAVASATGVPPRQVGKVMGALGALAAAELQHRGVFTLPGIARFRVVKPPVRSAARATRARRRVLELSPSKKLRDAIH